MHNNKQPTSCSLILGFCGFYLLSSIAFSVGYLTYKIVSAYDDEGWAFAFFTAGVLLFACFFAFGGVLLAFWKDDANLLLLKEWGWEQINAKSPLNLIKSLMFITGCYSMVLLFLGALSFLYGFY